MRFSSTATRAEEPSRLGQAFGHVEGVEGSLGTLDGFGVRRGSSASFQGGGTTSAVELVEGSGGSGLRRGVAFGGYFAVFFIEFVPGSAWFGSCLRVALGQPVGF